MSNDPNSPGSPKKGGVTPPPPGGARRASAEKAAQQEPVDQVQETAQPTPEVAQEQPQQAAPETTDAGQETAGDAGASAAPAPTPKPGTPPAPGGARKAAPAPGGARAATPASGGDDSSAPAPGGAPAPAPGGAPKPGGAPAPGGAKKGAPAPGGAKAGAPAPGGAPKPGGAPAPGGAPKPGGARAGAPAPGGAPKPGGAKAGAPAPGGAPKPGAAPKPGGSAPTPGGAAKGGAAAKTATKKPAAKKPAKKKEPVMIGERSLAEWGKLAAIGVGIAIVAAAIIVFLARWIYGLDAVQDWMVRYPGEYHLPEGTEEGFPAWVRWSHFLNFFFMVLIIRSGLLVRHQQKPPAYYTPRKGGKKISIYLWMHTMLDILWIVNGAIFIILLFVTTHWARLVPTSWDVFPNALSAMLQYASLNWPADDGWVNYNSLQQLMYFAVVFIAAPLAIISGLRMSEWWPEKAEKLNKIYPAPVARKIHYPTMLFFVLFIISHVFLVLATGMRKNLNAMFMGAHDTSSWGGFIWMVVALIVVIAAVFAARPLVLAPIAGRFGNISTR